MGSESTLTDMIKSYLQKVSERPGGTLTQNELGLSAQAKIGEYTFLFGYWNPGKDNGLVYVTVENEIGLPTAGFILNFIRVKATRNKYASILLMDIGENNCSKAELESIIKNLNISKEIFFITQ